MRKSSGWVHLFVQMCLRGLEPEVVVKADVAVVSRGFFFFFFQAEDGIRDIGVTGVQTCALPISNAHWPTSTVPSIPYARLTRKVYGHTAMAVSGQSQRDGRRARTTITGPASGDRKSVV